jgi:hypothetical protein
MFVWYGSMKASGRQLHPIDYAKEEAGIEFRCRKCKLISRAPEVAEAGGVLSEE